MTDAIKAFVKAQTEMGKAVKDRANPAFRSKYADLGNVQDACFPALHTNGFAVMQPNGVDEHGEFVETVFLHESGERFSTRVYLRVSKNDMQGYGSAMTYARRYGLMNLAGIAPEDDDGNAAIAAPPANRPEPRREPQRPAQGEPSPVDILIGHLEAARDLDELRDVWSANSRSAAAADPRAIKAKEDRKAALEAADDPFGLPPTRSVPAPGRAA